MRMTAEAFQAWSQRLQFSKETEALIAAIRSSPPVRRVSRACQEYHWALPQPKNAVLHPV